MYGARPYSRTEFIIDSEGRGREIPRRCPHHGEIRQGSEMYCEECAAYGRDYDKRLVIDAREMPKPEPRVVVVDEPEPTRAEKAGKPTSGKMSRRRKAKRQLAEVA